MDVSMSSRIKNAWNAFKAGTPRVIYKEFYSGSYRRPDRTRLTRGNERSIMTSVLNRIALDAAAIDIKHCRVDDKGRFKESIDSALNNCLSLSANLDQSGRAFLQDVVLTMFDEGCVALVPTDTTDNPYKTNSYDILTMRAAKIVEWFPSTVRVYVYNERIGKREEIELPKSHVAIIENPLYAIMNEHNSTLQRLTRKLVLLDSIDEQSGSGKLDLIIQLPYTIKSQARRDQANERRSEIERQLQGSKYGIAYTDGTEKITQLNRPVENNLMKQIEYLTSMLYSQLGVTQAVLDGTADEKTMLNYYSRTIEPIVAAIVDELKRKFLTKTARSQGQDIRYFRDPFSLVPVKDLAELADKFTRNEILSSNEFRGVIGYTPSDDPRADQLRNSNMPQSDGGIPPQETIPPGEDVDPESENNVDDPEYQQQVLDSLTDEQRAVVEDLINMAMGKENQ